MEYVVVSQTMDHLDGHDIAYLSTFNTVYECILTVIYLEIRLKTWIDSLNDEIYWYDFYLLYSILGFLLYMLQVINKINVEEILLRVTGCRFVQVADSYTCSFKAFVCI